MLKRLSAYFQANGNFFVKKEIDSDLFNWISRVRYKYREDQLNEEQIKSLIDIGFVFNTYNRVEKENEIGTQEKTWQLNYNNLKALLEEGKSFPQIIEINPVLNGWMQNQRFKQNRNKLKPHRKDLLDVINFPFDRGGGRWKGGKKSTRIKYIVTPEEWMQRYKDLLLFKAINGHIDVGTKDKNLYRWVKSQRQSFREDALNDEQLDLLRKIDFPLTINNEEELEKNWNEQFDELKLLFDKQGDNQIIRSHPLY
jgi:hypothetical protein